TWNELLERLKKSKIPDVCQLPGPGQDPIKPVKDRKEGFRHRRLFGVPDGRLQPAWGFPKPLKFIRLASSDGNVFFIKNDSDQPFDGKIWPKESRGWQPPLAAIMDPLDGRVGVANVEYLWHEPKKNGIYL